MKIETKSMGVIEISDDQKITMPEGFYGFEDYHEVALIDLEDKSLAFIVLDPFLFRPDYELEINDESLKPIGATNPENLLIFALVTIPVNGTPITANLQGPLVINKANKKGMQVVAGGEKWKTKHDVIAEMKAKGK